MDSKIFDNNYRITFIQNADFKTLNEYLKNMERLSKKGGKFLELYNKDVEYLLNHDIFDSGPDALNLFFATDSEVAIGDTETNIQHINKITQNTINKNAPTNTKIKNNIVQKLNELNKIEICIRDEYDQYNDQSIKNSVRNFINIIMSCSLMVSDGESKQNLMYYFKIITSLIKDNKIAIEEGYKYFSGILKKNNSKIIIDFIKKSKVLRNDKNKIPYQQYKKQKNDLIQDSISLYGIDNILTSILFNKIYTEHKKK